MKLSFSVFLWGIEQVSVDVKAVQDPNDLQFILDRLDIGGSKDQQVELSAVLAKYTNVFALEDEDLGYTGSSREVGPA